MRQRRGCWIFIGMVVLLLLAAGTKAEARKGGLLAMAGVLGLYLVFVQVQARLGLFTRRHFQPEATDALADDPRPNLLFLRSFHADNEYLVRTGGWLTSLLGRVSVPLEAALTEQLLDFGPVIAIGRPGEPLPPLGASRFYAPKDGEEWKRHVTEFADEAQLVVVLLGETEGLRWEYDLLARAGWLGKVVFVVPPVTGPALERVLAVFAAYVQAWGIEIEGEVGPDVVLFVPGGRGRFRPTDAPGLRTGGRLAPSARAYGEPLARLLDAADGLDLAEPITEAPNVVWPRRSLALFIDWFISVAGFSVLTLVIWSANDPSILKHAPRSAESEAVNDWVMWVGMLLSPVYFLVVEGLFGMSLGKRWCGVRVVDEDGRLPTWGRRLWRTVVKAASLILCVLPVAGLSALAGVCWHDRAAGTRVVAVRRSPKE